MKLQVLYLEKFCFKDLSTQVIMYSGFKHNSIKGIDTYCNNRQNKCF